MKITSANNSLKRQKKYEAPTLEVITVGSQTVLCASAPSFNTGSASTENMNITNITI